MYDLSYWNTIPPTLSPDGCTSNTQPGCSWYPLIDASGIHLPASLAGTQTPNKMTNTQDSEMAELRWQSTDTGSRWNWTVGVFWQLAKEGSIEELNSTNIDQVFNTLYGFSPTDYYGGRSTRARRMRPTRRSRRATSTTTATPPSIARSQRYGEVGFAITDRLKLTLGERVAHTEFSLNHYSDGYENYGPTPAQASESSTPNTPKVVLSFQADPRDLYYASWAKGFRVGGGNAPLPPYCDEDLAAAGFPNGAPLTYGSDNTQNFEVGAKNAFGNWLKVATSVYYIKWQDIQQNLYVAGACGLQFTDNLGTAVAKGFDLQAEMLFGPVNIDLATGYTSARFTKDAPAGCTPGERRRGRALPCGQWRRHLRSGRHQLRAGRSGTLAGGTRCRLQLQAHRAGCLRARGLGVSEPQSVAGGGAGPECRLPCTTLAFRTRCPRPASPRCARA